MGFSRLCAGDSFPVRSFQEKPAVAGGGYVLCAPLINRLMHGVK